MNFLASLQDTAISEWILYSDYGYYTVLSAHSIGMALVVGVVFMLTARTLGFASSVPIGIFDRLITVAWLGFILNLVTGIMVFMTNAVYLIEHVTFLIKMALIVFGGVTVWFLWRTLSIEPGVIDGSVAPSSKAKIVAIATTVFWLAAIVAGRLIAYT